MVERHRTAIPLIALMQVSRLSFFCADRSKVSSAPIGAKRSGCFQFVLSVFRSNVTKKIDFYIDAARLSCGVHIGTGNMCPKRKLGYGGRREARQNEILIKE
jgi:hypothetical protein